MASAKQAVMDLIRELPDDCTLEDIQYKLYVRQKIQRSLEAAAKGKVQNPCPGEEAALQVARKVI